MTGERTWFGGLGAARCAAVLMPVFMSTACVAETDPADAESAQEEESAARIDTYAQTQYPIVLCHGMAGFRSLFGVLDYFNGVESTLRDSGAEVYVTAVPQFDTTEARGEALLAQVEDIVARTGRAKVNLIGHSHGGLDIRYVAAVRPDLVASVTSVGSPHKGADLADYLQNNFKDGGFSQTVFSVFADSLGVILGLLSGHTTPQDSIAAIRSLSTEGTAAFNASYPAGLPSTACGSGPSVQNGIRFYSWAGTGTVTSLFDPSDIPFGLTSLVYSGENDGLVGKCSSHLGEVIRDDFFMNHLDEVNQLFGFTALFGTNPKSVFRTHVNRLKNAGL